MSTEVACGFAAGRRATVRPNDPMVGNRIGGVNVFEGGLGLYDSAGTLLGGLGVSGDTSCADHNIAYRTRNTLHLDYVPGGVAGGTRQDDIIFDIVPQGGGEAAPGAGQNARCQRVRLRPSELPRIQRGGQRNRQRDSPRRCRRTATDACAGRAVGSRPRMFPIPTGDGTLTGRCRQPQPGSQQRSNAGDRLGRTWQGSRSSAAGPARPHRNRGRRRRPCWYRIQSLRA